MKYLFLILLFSSISFTQDISGILIGDAQVLKSPDKYEKIVLASIKNDDTIKVISVVNDEFYEIKMGNIKGYIWAVNVRFEGENIMKIMNLKEQKRNKKSSLEEIVRFSNDIQDTLRYFFSAIFQGVAALLTLGAMFYMNYNERIKIRIRDLSKEINPIVFDKDEQNAKIRSNSIEVFIKKYSLPKKDKSEYTIADTIADEYQEIIRKQEKLKLIVGDLTTQGFVLLLISGCSLFVVGINEIINMFLFVFGAITLIILRTFLLLILDVFNVSTDLDIKSKFKFSYLKFIFKRRKI